MRKSKGRIINVPYYEGKIEEKVLDILKNFDRIKENPDKPKVIVYKFRRIYQI